MKKVLLFVCSIVLVFGALALTGCGTVKHQAVDSTSICQKCHGTERSIDSNGTVDTSNAQVSADGQIEVTVSGSEKLYVCTPYAAVDASTPIPVIKTTQTVTEGQATSVTLTEGTWMLVIQSEGNVYSQMITVDSSASSDFDGKVSLSV